VRASRWQTDRFLTSAPNLPTSVNLPDDNALGFIDVTPFVVYALDDDEGNGRCSSVPAAYWL
jgi:hypothetical protein